VRLLARAREQGGVSLHKQHPPDLLAEELVSAVREESHPESPGVRGLACLLCNLFSHLIGRRLPWRLRCPSWVSPASPPESPDTESPCWRSSSKDLDARR